MIKFPIRTLLLLIITSFLFSCSTHKADTLNNHIPPPLPDVTQTTKPKIVSNESQNLNPRNIIVQHAIQNLGRPYKWGGSSPKKGFDCSGLIVYTHQKANIQIPRTAKAQFLSGKLLAKKDLKPADLVFFKNPYSEKTYHVGIYIGENTFVHAPGKGRQVTYGYLSNPYFKKHYIGSKTYL